MSSVLSRSRSRVWLAMFVLALASCARESVPKYKDPNRPIKERVANLLSQMTVEEKVAQMQAIWRPKTKIQDGAGRFDPAHAPEVLGYGLGEFARPSEIASSSTGPRLRTAREQAEFVNAVQHWVMEHTRLAIPVMFHDEAVHGLVALHATSFPVPIALASSWDPALVERVMSAAAFEARARGSSHVLAPVIDLGRDPRWGRFEETYGEDPYLVSRLGVAAIRGYQGATLPLGPHNVLATLKHFAGHGSNEAGVNAAPSLVPERLLRSELLAPFEAAVKETTVFTVMPSYNEIDGVPSHANRWLLEDVLRREWGFQGAVVSDFFGIQQLVSRQKTAVDLADAAVQSLNAGVDMELPDGNAFLQLQTVIKDGRVTMARIDAAVSRILEMKMIAGLFEHPYVDVDEAERSVHKPEHQALALEAARRSIVLLENRNHALPLDRAKIKTLAVVGPNARGLRRGGYSADPGRGVDVLSGITSVAGAGVKIVYSEGVRITEADPNWDKDEVVMGDPVKNRQRIKDAVASARAADAIVLAIGTNESTAREAWSDDHRGDVADLALMSQQDELADALFDTGKPVIVVLINGRPLAIPRIAERASAILEAWYVGQEGGTAIGEVLFGDVNPGGKLPVTIPRSVGQLPVYYNRRPTSFRPYLDMTREPLWPFGHGLSYTTFSISDPIVTPAAIPADGRATVSVDVSNTGSRWGDEVVQLYIHDLVSSVTRPVLELRGFKRVSLEPGTRRTVTFTLGPDELSLIDRSMRRVVEPGQFEIFVGSSSVALKKATLDVTPRR
ncbi:MAG TPA: glycoside hydrolase family 3 N-terminal domain-containing protein [Vicinamibacterales bacterium]|nr:glycoside hydrolase family 3 N-terminal domain-containing protein [Vicinamibacterales bacterium]